EKDHDHDTTSNTTTSCNPAQNEDHDEVLPASTSKPLLSDRGLSTDAFWFYLHNEFDHTDKSFYILVRALWLRHNPFRPQRLQSSHPLLDGAKIHWSTKFPDRGVVRYKVAEFTRRAVKMEKPRSTNTATTKNAEGVEIEDEKMFSIPFVLPGDYATTTSGTGSSSTSPSFNVDAVVEDLLASGTVLMRGPHGREPEQEKSQMTTGGRGRGKQKSSKHAYDPQKTPFLHRYWQRLAAIMKIKMLEKRKRSLVREEQE
ncbi:unnamed protein product, partial [Amoebophrya sp. A25]